MNISFGAASHRQAAWRKVGGFDKLHLAQFGRSVEKTYFSRGDHLFVFKLDGFSIAPIICYDIRPPELTRTLAVDHGVDLVLHCSAHFRDETFHTWHHFSVCRAVENQIYFLSLNRAGENYGNSFFCTPWIDENSPGIRFPQTDEKFQSIEIDANLIKGVRREFTLLEDRFDDYSSLPPAMRQPAFLTRSRSEGGLLDSAIRVVVPGAEPLDLLFTYDAIVIGHVHSFLPYMILTCYVSLQAIDGALIEAARTLGAPGWVIFRRIILPLSVPDCSPACRIFPIAWTSRARASGQRSSSVIRISSGNSSFACGRIEHIAGVQGEPGKREGACLDVPGVHAVRDVPGVSQNEYGDGLRLRIDDPVLRDCRFGVVVTFVDEVSLGTIRTEDLHDCVGSGPEAIAAARVSCIADQQQVRLAKLALTNAQAKRREQHLPASGPEECVQCRVEKGKNPLVPAGRHREYLQVSIGELYQTPGMVGQPEIGVIAPASLGKYILQQAVNLRLRYGFAHQDRRHDVRPCRPCLRTGYDDGASDSIREVRSIRASSSWRRGVEGVSSSQSPVAQFERARRPGANAPKSPSPVRIIVRAGCAPPLIDNEMPSFRE